MSKEFVHETENDGLFDELDEIDREIIRLKLENPAIQNIEIAKRLGYHFKTISKRLNKTKVKKSLAYLQMTAYEKIMDRHAEIIAGIWRLAKDSPDDSVKLRAYMKFLDKLVPDKKEIEGTLDSNITIVMDSDFLPDEDEENNDNES